MFVRPLVTLLGLFWVSSAMAIDIATLWDLRQPALSEQRFRAALPGADADDTLILQTQIARTHGLRRDFVRARQILQDIEPQTRGAGAEVRVRHAPEWGRTLASAAHPAQTQTPQTRALARAAYLRAVELAKTHRLDGLAIDALHMLAYVDTAPGEQLKWGQDALAIALAIALASSQPAAKQWEASLRNNIGHALHPLGRDAEALVHFRLALTLREPAQDVAATRIAHWMVARSLRALNRIDEALDIQSRLEREWVAEGQPDPHVFEELEAIYSARGDAVRAQAYALRKKAAGGTP